MIELNGVTTKFWFVTGWPRDKLKLSLNWRLVTGSNPPSPRNTPVVPESIVKEKVPSCAVVEVKLAPLHVPEVTSIQTVALWIGPAPKSVPSIPSVVTSSEVSFVTVTVKSLVAVREPSDTLPVNSYTLFVSESDGFS